MVSSRQRRINRRNFSNLEMLGEAFVAIGTGLGSEVKAAFTSKQFWEQQGQSFKQMGTKQYWKQMGTGKYWENAGKNAIMYNQFAALGGMESNDPAKRQAAMSAMAGLFVAGGVMAVTGGVVGAAAKMGVGGAVGDVAGEELAQGAGEGIATRGAGEGIATRQGGEALESIGERGSAGRQRVTFNQGVTSSDQQIRILTKSDDPLEDRTVVRDPRSANSKVMYRTDDYRKVGETSRTEDGIAPRRGFSADEAIRSRLKKPTDRSHRLMSNLTEEQKDEVFEANYRSRTFGHVRYDLSRASEVPEEYRGSFIEATTRIHLRS